MQSFRCGFRICRECENEVIGFPIRAGAFNHEVKVSVEGLIMAKQ